jgi:hypothetical protein
MADDRQDGPGGDDRGGRAVGPAGGARPGRGGRASVRTAILVLAVVFAGRPAATAAEPDTVLGITGTSFTLNGKKTFIVGISYYAGLGATDDRIRADLDSFREAGFNWLRVWVTWAGFGNDVSAVGADGRPREPYLKTLRFLVAEADRRGLVVDVTLSRGDGKNDSPHLPTMAAHRRAVETVTAALKGRRNWYLDLANERNIGDARHVPVDELKALRAVARKIDPHVPVTASAGGDMSRDDVRESLTTVGLDFLTPHRPRGADSPKQTEAKTREYLKWAADLGRPVPVHYQEPFRRGYGRFDPTVDDFLTDLKGARAGGAAGWCLHNGSQRTGADGRPRRSFDLRGEGKLLDRLDAVEREVVRRLAGS